MTKYLKKSQLPWVQIRHPNQVLIDTVPLLFLYQDFYQCVHLHFLFLDTELGMEPSLEME